MDENLSFFARVMRRFIKSLREQDSLSGMMGCSEEQALDYALALWRECMRMETEAGGLDKKTRIAAGVIGVVTGGKKSG